MKSYEKPGIAQASRANALVAQSVPFNAEMYLLDDFAEVVAKTEVNLSSEVYWEKGLQLEEIQEQMTERGAFSSYSILI